MNIFFSQQDEEHIRILREKGGFKTEAEVVLEAVRRMYRQEERQSALEVEIQKGEADVIARKTISYHAGLIDDIDIKQRQVVYQGIDPQKVPAFQKLQKVASVPRKVELSTTAVEGLEKILHHLMDQYGYKAEHKQKFYLALESLCESGITGEFYRSNIYFLNAGQHFIVCRIEAEKVVVLRILANYLRP